MQKCTSRRARAKVKAYILSHINFDGYEPNIPKSDSWEDMILWTYGIFIGEKRYEIERIGVKNALHDWLYGLASALYLPFLYSDSAIATLKDWLQLSDEQADKKSEEQCEEKLLSMVIYEIFDTLNKRPVSEVYGIMHGRNLL